jgi:polysaccharide export outer membrane protein
VKSSISRRLLRQLFALISLMTIYACSPDRNLVYFSDLPQTTDFRTPISNYVAPRIQPGDILSVTVSSLNAESNVLFNNVLLPAVGGSNIIADKINEGYLVDNEGAINFPVIGKVPLTGLTKEEATDKMTQLVRNHVKDPIINIRFANFKVTVIGEVNRPATFIVETEKINVLEALGLAGDMTEYGRRENVLIIREKAGERSAVRIDLNQKDVFNSPYFYMQQNDIIYVEPDNKVKVAQTAPGNRYVGIWAAVISVIGFTAITFIRETN